MPQKMYIRDKRSPIPKNERVSLMMSRVKGTNTALEKVFRSALYRQGIRGYRVNYTKLPGKPDICFIGKKIAIFINGCYWHRCPKCKPHTPNHNKEYWATKFARTQARDKIKQQELLSLGWKVVVIWECEINKNLETVTKQLINLIDSYSSE